MLYLVFSRVFSGSLFTIYEDINPRPCSSPEYFFYVNNFFQFRSKNLWNVISVLSASVFDVGSSCHELSSPQV